MGHCVSTPPDEANAAQKQRNTEETPMNEFAKRHSIPSMSTTINSPSLNGLGDKKDSDTEHDDSSDSDCLTNSDQSKGQTEKRLHNDSPILETKQPRHQDEEEMTQENEAKLTTMTLSQAPKAIATENNSKAATVMKTKTLSHTTTVTTTTVATVATTTNKYVANNHNGPSSENGDSQAKSTKAKEISHKNEKADTNTQSQDKRSKDKGSDKHKRKLKDKQKHSLRALFSRKKHKSVDNGDEENEKEKEEERRPSVAGIDSKSLPLNVDDVRFVPLKHCDSYRSNSSSSPSSIDTPMPSVDGTQHHHHSHGHIHDGRTRSSSRGADMKKQVCSLNNIYEHDNLLKLRGIHQCDSRTKRSMSLRSVSSQHSVDSVHSAHSVNSCHSGHSAHSGHSVPSQHSHHSKHSQHSSHGSHGSTHGGGRGSRHGSKHGDHGRRRHSDKHRRSHSGDYIHTKLKLHGHHDGHSSHSGRSQHSSSHSSHTGHTSHSNNCRNKPRMHRGYRENNHNRSHSHHTNLHDFHYGSHACEHDYQDHNISDSSSEDNMDDDDELNHIGILCLDANSNADFCSESILRTIECVNNDSHSDGDIEAHDNSCSHSHSHSNSYHDCIDDYATFNHNYSNGYNSYSCQSKSDNGDTFDTSYFPTNSLEKIPMSKKKYNRTQDGRVKIRVLFLDVDGVLNGENHGYDGIEQYQLSLLKQILELTECRIVLSSTWRLNRESKKSLCSILQMKGDINVDRIIIGQTPYLKEYRNNCCQERVQEIGRYLESSKSLANFEVISWCAIDDMPLSKHDYKGSNIMKGHFVRTDHKTGLLQQNVYEVFSLLMEGTQSRFHHTDY